MNPRVASDLASAVTPLGDAASSHGRPRPFDRVDVRVYLLSQVILVTAVLAVAAHTLRQSGTDVDISRLFFDERAAAFEAGHSAWLEILGHQAARALPVIVGAFALAAALASNVVDALRPWRAILFALAAAVIAGPALVSVLKSATTAHCPHDMQMFGGVVDDAKESAGPLWASSTGSAGRCLPSGHASGGYALLALYFAGWAAGRPVWRRRGLAIGVAAGVLFSAVRVVQGAHFPSQTVWSAAVDWCLAGLIFMPLLCRWPWRPAEPGASRPAADEHASELHKGPPT